ncbi:MAG: ABC transporter permease [Thermodesulfovibrionales bacterium]|nr:ABC transporter permease [Thermodesulfovibrionales bacterium]
MRSVAIKMLVGDRAKYLGIIMGLTFASFLITEQLAIFTGLMTRTFGFITDTSIADIWVMDPKVQFVDDIKPMQDMQLYRTRGVEGVEWAVPLYKGLLKAKLENGNYQTVILIGLDDATLVGAPPVMLGGQSADLRRSEAVIVDTVGAAGKLSKPSPLPGAKRIPLAIGDNIEINDNRATVVGICRVSRTFQSQPVVYTTYSRATTFAPKERKLLSFILVKAKPGEDINALAARIRKVTGLAAHTRDGFKELTVRYYMKYTGIPINFGMAVLLGFIVGTAIAGQTFYNFTLENLKHFGTLKAMGASNKTLLGMIVLQALMVGGIGYGLGVGAATIFGKLVKGTELAFRLPWQLLVITAVAITLICIFAALLSIRKVIKLEPAIVFKT